MVEVKGSKVWCEDDGWRIERDGKPVVIDPVGQARNALYAFRDCVTSTPEWGSRTPVRWAHAVVLPYTRLDDDFDLVDARRWQVAGSNDMPRLAEFLRAVVTGQQNTRRLLDADDIDVIVESLKGRGLPQRDLIGEAEERNDEVERLSAEQAVILDAARLLNRIEVRGGAGSGKRGSRWSRHAGSAGRASALH